MGRISGFILAAFGNCQISCHIWTYWGGCKHGRVPKSCQESIHKLGMGRISGLILISGCIRLFPIYGYRVIIEQFEDAVNMSGCPSLVKNPFKYILGMGRISGKMIISACIRMVSDILILMNMQTARCHVNNPFISA